MTMVERSDVRSLDYADGCIDPIAYVTAYGDDTPEVAICAVKAGAMTVDEYHEVYRAWLMAEDCQ